jgi:hypothetical protein
MMFFLQQAHILSLKQPNYNKVLKPDKIHMIIDAFNNREIAGGGRKGFSEASTQMENHALHRLEMKQRSRRSPLQATEGWMDRRRRR